MSGVGWASVNSKRTDVIHFTLQFKLFKILIGNEKQICFFIIFFTVETKQGNWGRKN